MTTAAALHFNEESSVQKVKFRHEFQWSFFNSSLTLEKKNSFHKSTPT